MATPPVDAAKGRYSRQVLFSEIGVDGQRRLAASRVTIIGCGALGSVQASTLARAGVGFIRLCDRDFVELDNLQRQVLFDEADVGGNLPKAEAARRKLASVNSEIEIDARVLHVEPANIDEVCRDAHLILDGTDNFETRFLINDWAVMNNRPWIYGAVIGAAGLAMVVIPGQTACIRCVFEEAPPPEMNPTCDTAGVLGPAVNLVASWQCQEAIKLLAGRADALIKGLISIDAWAARIAILDARRAEGPQGCPCCVRHRYDFLEGDALSATTVLCGRDAVQVRPAQGTTVNLLALSEKLKASAQGEIQRNPFLLRARLEPYDVTVFPDGRAIIKGTKDLARARSFYSRFIGA